VASHLLPSAGDRHAGQVGDHVDKPTDHGRVDGVVVRCDPHVVVAWQPDPVGPPDRRWDRRQIVARVLRPRVLVYTSILGAIVLATAASLFLRVPLKVDVIRDRGSLARQVEDDRIENVYRLQVMNTREVPVTVAIGVKPTRSLEHIEVLTDGSLEIPATTTRTITVRVRAEPEHVRGSVPIEFVVGPVTEKSRFLVP